MNEEQLIQNLEQAKTNFLVNPNPKKYDHYKGLMDAAQKALDIFKSTGFSASNTSVKPLYEYEFSKMDAFEHLTRTDNRNNIELPFGSMLAIYYRVEILIENIMTTTGEERGKYITQYKAEASMYNTLFGQGRPLYDLSFTG